MESGKYVGGTEEAYTYRVLTVKYQDFTVLRKNEHICLHDAAIQLLGSEH